MADGGAEEKQIQSLPCHESGLVISYTRGECEYRKGIHKKETVETNQNHTLDKISLGRQRGHQHDQKESARQ